MAESKSVEGMLEEALTLLQWPTAPKLAMLTSVLIELRAAYRAEAEARRMQSTETAPTGGPILFAVMGDEWPEVHKGYTYRDPEYFDSVETEGYASDRISFHRDQVLGWWPLPTVPR